MTKLFLAICLMLSAANAFAESYVSGFGCVDASGRQIGDYNVYQIQPGEDYPGSRGRQYFWVNKLSDGAVSFHTSAGDAQASALANCRSIGGKRR